MLTQATTSSVVTGCWIWCVCVCARADSAVDDLLHFIELDGGDEAAPEVESRVWTDSKNPKWENTASSFEWIESQFGPGAGSSIKKQPGSTFCCNGRLKARCCFAQSNPFRTLCFHPSFAALKRRIFAAVVIPLNQILSQDVAQCFSIRSAFKQTDLLLKQDFLDRVSLSHWYCKQHATKKKRAVSLWFKSPLKAQNKLFNHPQCFPVAAVRRQR